MMAVYAPEQVKTPEEIEIMRYANQVRSVSRETHIHSLPERCAYFRARKW